MKAIIADIYVCTGCGEVLTRTVVSEGPILNWFLEHAFREGGFCAFNGKKFKLPLVDLEEIDAH